MHNDFIKPQNFKLFASNNTNNISNNKINVNQNINSSKSYLNNEKLVWWLRLNALNFLGNNLKANLIRKFQNPEIIFHVSHKDLLEVEGWTTKKLEKFLSYAKSHANIPIPNLQELEKNNIKIITFNDKNYPPLLKEISDPPIILYVRGNLTFDTSNPTIAIVGARKASQLGLEMARSLAYDLASMGFVIVSGLALGIDTYAHLGALDYKSGVTVAVLASSHDLIYPHSNIKLYKQIICRGAVISEYSIKISAKPWHFPIRNRIISGMCDGVIVVEASSKSGSLITAKLAVEQNRDVFALPGPINSELSQGNLNLIKDGATLITSSIDIINFYKNKYPKLKSIKSQNSQELDNSQSNQASIINNLSDSEIKILKLLSSSYPISLEKLLTCKNMIKDNIFTVLLSLEMKNLIVKFPGNYYKSKINIPALF